MSNYEQPQEYRLDLPGDGEAVAEFVDGLIKKFPGADIKIEKFTKNIGYRRQEAEIKIEDFIAACKKSQPLGASVLPKTIEDHISRSGQEEKVLEFFVREIIIDGEEHCVWIRIPDTQENKNIINYLALKLQK